MSTFNGLPAHILLVHFIVVLAPLTAVLEIACALWPAARRRLVWLVVALAGATLVLTPLTTDAGEWLEKRAPRTAGVRAHTEMGDWMIYFSVALLVVALVLAVVHWRERSTGATHRLLAAAVAVLALAVGIATVVQVYRIGDSGARATWGEQFDPAPAITAK